MSKGGPRSQGCLPGFYYLAPSIYLFDPSLKASFYHLDNNESTFSLSLESSPSLVLLFPWTGASLQHVAKYTSTYMSIYPSTPILVITTTLADLAYRSSAQKQHHLLPAILYLLHRSNASYLDNILVHCFSEGGSNKAVEFAKSYQSQTGTNSKLPISTLILDSTPGTPRFTMMASAFRKSLPRNPAIQFIATLAAYSVPACLWTVYRLTPGPASEKDVISQTRRTIEDESLWGAPGVPRCYLYSEADALVYWKDVEDHAMEARLNGTPAFLEKFTESAHCCHARADAARYWSAIQRTWECRDVEQLGEYQGVEKETIGIAV